MISLLISLAVLGVIVYCLTLLPMPAPFAQIIRILACLIAVLMVLDFFGVGGIHLYHRF